MDNFKRNTTLKNILENYLTQEKITLYRISKENNISVKTLNKILENTTSNFSNKTLKKLYALKNIKKEDKEIIKGFFKKEIIKKRVLKNDNFIFVLEEMNKLIKENQELKEQIKGLTISEKDNNYFKNREIGAFNSDIHSNSLLITKIWDFNKNILNEWADIKMLLEINPTKKTIKIRKGLKNIAKNLIEIGNFLESTSFNSDDLEENEIIIELNKED